jgi:hypothetical protein
MAAIPPESLFELAPDRPDVTGAVMVEMLDGFIDAGAARRLAREHLMSTSAGLVVARFDVDLLHDYRARRPQMLFVEDHWESYSAPALEIRMLTDTAGAPYLVLAGSEPDVMWERFVAAALMAVEQLGVRLTVGTNAIPMAVPHTRPVGVTAHAARQELIAEYAPWVTTVGVPGSAGHLLEYRLAAAGRDSMGFAVHVPHYVAQAVYPPAAESLLRAVARAGGLQLDLEALESAGRETQESIDGLVAQSDELTGVVRGLEEQYDAFVAGRASLGEPGSLPTADELGAELERFLADQAKRHEDPQ